MPTVILNHRVNDYATWKTKFDSDVARRENAGLKEIAVGQKAGDPGNVYVVWDVADASVLQPMLSDPELQKTMKEAGVISAPELVVVE
jgi:hypothetical protein